MVKGPVKNPTTDSPRLPSTAPGDLDHLGVPGALDFKLDHPRSRRRRGRRSGMPNWAKALLAMAGGVLAFLLVMLVIFVIAFPPFFRGLEPRYQQRLIGIFPPFDALRATVPFQVLPTLGGAEDSSAAQQLLLTQEDTTAAPTAQQSPASGIPSGEAGEEGPAVIAPGEVPPPVTPIPTPEEVGMAATDAATPLPVYVAPTEPPAPIFTPLVAPTDIPTPPSYQLSPVRYEKQGWNNCGPTTMTMALSYYGWGENQYTAAAWMKPHKEDKNVSPWQMVKFVNDFTGLNSLYRYGGTTTMIKRLIAANFPVVIEESIQPANEGWMGHYVLIVGYDDYRQEFLTYDSYLGQNRPRPFVQFDQSWREFNRIFMVIYEPTREADLRLALGDYVDPVYGYRVALDTARYEAQQNRDDKWAWFNMGTAYVSLKEYENAAYAYDESFRLGLPFRTLWYQFGPYEAYFNTGRYSDVLARAGQIKNTTPYVEESYYWEGMAFAAQGDARDAITRFDEALRFNRNFFPAQEAKAQVEAGTFSVASAHS